MYGLHTTDGFLREKSSNLPSSKLLNPGSEFVSIIGILVVDMKFWMADRNPLSSSNITST